ncbi:hypothetical protein [Leptolyngbya iicbica]|uniref:Uncharacterized protein n=2 Tax=Cyanophyceae TaxID=3028117 RepID=A0A4Q7E2H9_9CYAN|nr:hypothetical protein [Leptolyngbya sp. LK]RZM75586.1 hypothetical protein DYY88_19970 [Leptolyngbya sp. LK]
MTLRLRTSHYRFVYAFASGHELVGTMIGDSYGGQSDYVFNVRSLRAIALTPQGNLMMSFDEVFGQFTRTTAETILSGSHSQKESFFSINSRNDEACIYDAATEQWVTSGWLPGRWTIEELPLLPSMMSSVPACSKRLASVWSQRAMIA